jgi:hypothetical protein
LLDDQHKKLWTWPNGASPKMRRQRRHRLDFDRRAVTGWSSTGALAPMVAG